MYQRSNNLRELKIRDLKARFSDEMYDVLMAIRDFPHDYPIDKATVILKKVDYFINQLEQQ
jgi:hypothetical protein